MNLRWLLGNFTDPQHQLPRREQFRLSAEAHRRFVSGRTFFTRTAVIVAPFLGLLALLKPVLESLGYGGRNLPFIIAIAALLVLFWPWSAWMYRSTYVGPIRRVMHDVGYDLCLRCGYDLRGLPSAVTRCPECGALRELVTPPSSARREANE